MYMYVRQYRACTGYIVVENPGEMLIHILHYDENYYDDIAAP